MQWLDTQEQGTQLQHVTYAYHTNTCIRQSLAVTCVKYPTDTQTSIP
jgi:hypothetical protein